MLESVEWGEFKIGDLFEKIKTTKLPFKADELPKSRVGEYTLPCLTSSFNNQGLNYFVPRSNATILKNVISIPSNSDVYRAYFQPNEFTVLSDAYAIQWAFGGTDLSPNQYLFAVQCINKVTDLHIYSYKNKLGGWNVVKQKSIQLPIKNGQIDLDFMELFIARLEEVRIEKLEIYLSAAGLNDYHLTLEEQEALDLFQQKKFLWEHFEFQNIFDNISQGRRVKKDDQVPGKIPFVMSGITNTGVVNFISNPIAQFKKNSITVDIFGSAFYRSYDFGAGDDTGVYSSSVDKYSKEQMLFFTASMDKALENKFDYGNKLRSSQSLNLKMQLLTKDNQPDLSSMGSLMSAIQKLVIKDVIKYTENKSTSS